MGVSQPQVSPYGVQAGNAGFTPPAAGSLGGAFAPPPAGMSMPGVGTAVAPPMMSTPSNAPLPMPTPQVGAINYASTAPVGGFGALPEIPPPNVVAPNLFNSAPARPPMPITYPGNYQNNFYNYPAYPGQPSQAMPQQPALQQPLPPPQQQLPPQQPPRQQPPAPPQQQQPPVQPPAANAANKPPVTQQLGSGTLDDAKVRNLNTRLNSGSATERSDASMDFFNLLQANPGLADNPQYKPYVDAFMEKILNDPSALVRQAGLLAMETGLLKNPSNNTRQILGNLSKGNGLYNIEPGSAQSILSSLGSPAPQFGSKLDLTSTQDNSIGA